MLLLVTPPTINNPQPPKIGEVAGREETIYYDPQQISIFGLECSLGRMPRLFVLGLLAGALASLA